MMTAVSEPLAARLFFPFVEREFTYGSYRRFAERLARTPALDVVPLRELLQPAPPEKARLGLRHDVDDSLEHALALGRIEHELGLRSTYFVLHTAPYWRSSRLVEMLLELQDGLGHEIGWHNDLVTLGCVHAVDAGAYLHEQLARLRAAGLSVEGTASHGSPWCHALGYHNQYFFEEFPPIPGFPSYEVVPTPWGETKIEKSTLASFGFTYEAYFLGEQRYLSDSTFEHGRRWHPDALVPAELAAGETAIVLVHPCHWDASQSAKFARAARRVSSRLLRELRGAPRPGRYRGATPPPLP